MYIYLYIYVCLKKAHIHISILVIYDDSDVMGYDRRRAELSYAHLHMKQDTNSIEKYLPKVQSKT